jgi:hypothetical protein
MMSDSSFDDLGNQEVPGVLADGSSNNADTFQTERFAHGLNNRGMWLMSTGRPLLAVHCFQRACDTFPMLASAWVNLAATLTMLGDTDQAGRVISRARNLGALTRQAATRYRTATAGSSPPEPIVANRHRIKRDDLAKASLCRPSERRVTSNRRPPSIYLLLMSAACDINWEGKIPTA